ncbi:dihydrolipoamide acetyltransferase family protein [Pseudohoeflea coraliihabitans]|uniref:Dihydrolipoamide acetyltransferase component of pyruvate dehydrogenase complex n=1 Tax=Pseudohoeflea coraliihabitans TaxID=2860393 RepID=A0ABS6WJ62_9HYPH|nr:dihydrolipoamide acetyltransferase family protein [Pseudohoeflea sp. DP4N28-3]MBW3095979.1 2-oxo acid dehydrogenase subunit E2 [Pseudohoeflea sp. DP4N28-3]
MTHEIAIPKLGLTMTDCTLVDWHKSDGDRVEPGEVLFAIETDKITSEVEADGAGYLRRYAEVESTHTVGSVIGGLYATQEAALSAGIDQQEAAADTPAPVVEEIERPFAPAAVDKGSRQRVSPLARRIAREAGIDPRDLTGTGARGAILRRDVDAEIERRGKAPAETTGAAAAGATGEASRRPLSGLRRSIARNMMQSLQSTAQMTAFARVDMAEVVALRKACLAREADTGVRISFTDIVLKACAIALARMPEINASIIGEEIVSWADVNVGLAVALDDGLLVPVIHNADRKSLVEIARERIDLAARARSGQLERHEMQGGTFSLSNFGSYGGDFETPLLNPPQSAILGIGAIGDEAVVRDGQIVIRPMMMLSMTFDHRLIDGAVAGRYRNVLRSLLESPYTMLADLR